jgi:hypothetical protein
MSGQWRRRLSTLLALAPQALVGDDGSSKRDWIDATKNPVDWLTWGADLRLRNDSAENPSLRDDDPPGHTYSFERLRLREWNNIVAFAPLELNLRLTWEGRHYWAPASKDAWDRSDIIVDSLYVKLTLPLITVVAGRQDMVFGEGWLISDGTPLDGPRTNFFDAARLTFDLAPLKSTLDLVYIDQRGSPNARLPPLFSRNKPLMEQNERAGVVYLIAQPIASVRIDLYGIYKHDEPIQANGDSGGFYTVGTSLTVNLGRHWLLRDEGAYQFGHRKNTVLFPNQDDQLSAWGNNGRLALAFLDTRKNQLWLGYEVLSGNDAHDIHNHQFDPLWGRWARYSELFPNEFDRPSERSNLERFNVGYQVEPILGMQILANYHAIFAYAHRFAGTAGYSNGGDFKGHLVTAMLKHSFNRVVMVKLLVEYFKPGNYYAAGDGPLGTRLDPATFVRGEVFLTF